MSPGSPRGSSRLPGPARRDEGDVGLDGAIKSDIIAFMAQVIIRNLDEATVVALKARARARGRSLEQELRLLLAAAARPTRQQIRETAASIRALSRQRVSTDLEELVRQDRRR